MATADRYMKDILQYSMRLKVNRSRHAGRGNYTQRESERDEDKRAKELYGTKKETHTHKYTLDLGSNER